MANKEMWNTIRNKVKQYPEQLDMNNFRARSSCGTTYCLIGWAVNLGFIDNNSIVEFHDALDLSPDSFDELKTLCFPTRWTPKEWQEYADKKHLFVLRKMDEFWAKYGENE